MAAVVAVVVARVVARAVKTMATRGTKKARGSRVMRVKVTRVCYVFRVLWYIFRVLTYQSHVTA